MLCDDRIDDGHSNAVSTIFSICKVAFEDLFTDIWRHAGSVVFDAYETSILLCRGCNGERSRTVHRFDGVGNNVSDQSFKITLRHVNRDGVRAEVGVNRDGWMLAREIGQERLQNGVDLDVWTDKAFAPFGQ